jgi:mannose-6-phosphate isomerase-like protein (cupin superfamily)
MEVRPEWQCTPASAPTPDNRELWVFGNHVKLKLTSANSNGQVSVIEGRVMPGGAVPPHAHNREEEMFYMLEGTCRFVLDGKPVDVGAGGFVYVPQGAMHGFSNPGTGKSRFLNYHTPGGFENFFLDAGIPCADASTPPTDPIDIPRAVELMKKHGMTFPS